MSKSCDGRENFDSRIIFDLFDKDSGLVDEHWEFVNEAFNREKSFGGFSP